MFWWRKLKERDHLAELSVGRRIIVKYILKRMGRRGLDLSESG
jgi:hypothetical protein